jgi:PAS domain S-box-containing protein
LLVNEQAEEIKQATISMRQSYPGCRVEAVYSGEEALEWASKEPWQVILLDQNLSNRSSLDIVTELRRCTPSSVIILQAEQHDAATAAQAIRAGADMYLYKKSPAFLTELPIVTRVVLEHRKLQKELDQAREQHLRPIEAFPDLIYELSAEGHFVSIEPGIMPLLGYSPEELIGTHYSSLLHPDEWRTAWHHMHERRTSQRAWQAKPVRLIGKHGGVVRVTCQTAGLYGSQREFLGTVGIIKRPTDEGPPSVVSTGAGLAPVRTQYAGPTPSPAPAVREPGLSYPERRRANRTPVQMKASLHLRDTSFEGLVREISLFDLYAVIEGAPPVVQNQPVRLDFSIEGAILGVQGKIAEIRVLASSAQLPHRSAGIGLVVLYTDVGPIERPILSSLLQELRVHPACARVTMLPSLARNVNSN